MEQASSAFSTGVPALAAIPQLAGNSRQGFGPVDGTMRWASGWVISSNTLGLSTSLYDSDAGSRSTGKEHDNESGNDYFGARYYESAVGRFLSPDWSAKVEPVPYAKLDDPQSLNLYAYVRNNPLARVDADGHQSGPDRFGCSEGQKDCNTDQQKAQQYNNVTGYLTPDQAARAALTIANPQSISDNKEMGGLVYEDKSGAFHYTTAIEATETHVNPFKSPAPNGTTVVGDYHTHGDYSIKGPNDTVVRTSSRKRDDFKSDHFSNDDKSKINKTGIAFNMVDYRGYLGTPSGRFLVYSTAVGEEKNLP